MVVRYYLVFNILLSQTCFSQQVLSDSLYNRDCQQHIRYYVILPNHYPKDNCTYKILYVLHGAWSCPEDYLKKTKLSSYCETHNLILVLPSSHLQEGDKKIVNTWYINSRIHKQIQWQSALRQLDSLLKKQYKVLLKSGVMGLSMGGYGAVYSAINQPELFSTVSTLSAVFQLPVQKPIQDQEWLFGEDNLSPEYDLIHQARRLKGKSIRFLVSCGTEDRFYKDGQNTAMLNALKKSGVKVIADFSPGTHSWTYWDSILEKHLQFHDIEQKY